MSQTLSETSIVMGGGTISPNRIRCNRSNWFMARYICRCSVVSYPSDGIQASFVRFATTLEADLGSVEGLSILAALAANPLEEMARLGWFDLNTPKELVQAMLPEEKKDRMGGGFEKLSGKKLPAPVWTPFIIPDSFLKEEPGVNN